MYFHSYQPDVIILEDTGWYGDWYIDEWYRDGAGNTTAEINTAENSSISLI